MTSYRTLLLAGAVVLGATSAYAGDGHEDILNRDSINVHHSAPRTHLLERRTSQGALAPYAYSAPYAYGGASSRRDPRASAYEPGSSWTRIPQDYWVR